MALSFLVFRNRDFKLLFLSRMFTWMAIQSQAVIVGWQIYSLTKSPFILGLTGLCEAIPALFCALFAGYIVDKSRPYKINLIAISVFVVNIIVMLIFAGEIIPIAKNLLIIVIFIGVFISGIARSFAMPSAFSLYAQVMTKSEYASGTAWFNTAFQFATIVGPALAGIIYGGYGARTAWAMSAISMLMALISLYGISNHPRKYQNISKESAIKSMVAGWKFILNNKIILPVISLDMFAVLLGGAVSMLPAYADQVLHVGSQGLGLLRSATAFGAIGMALFLAIKPMRYISGKLLLIAVAGFGFSIIGFGLSKIFWLSMLFLALSGAFDCISVVIRATLNQTLTPENMKGRISSVSSMFIISSNELGAFESGLAARVLGLVPSVVFGGLGTLLVVAVTSILSPQLRKLKLDL